MVPTQHKPVFGSAEYVEHPVSPEIQEELSRADAAVPDELRERYPDQWIALLPTPVDQHDQLIAGRLITVADDWSTFDAVVQSFRRDYPGLFPFTYFTGRYPMGRDVVHVCGPRFQTRMAQR